MHDGRGQRYYIINTKYLWSWLGRAYRHGDLRDDNYDINSNVLVPAMGRLCETIDGARRWRTTMEHEDGTRQYGAQRWHPTIWRTKMAPDNMAHKDGTRQYGAWRYHVTIANDDDDGNARSHEIFIGVASMRQEEAIASSWIFKLTMILPVVLQARTRKWSKFQPIITS